MRINPAETVLLHALVQREIVLMHLGFDELMTGNDKASVERRAVYFELKRLEHSLYRSIRVMRRDGRLPPMEIPHDPY